MQPSGYSHPRTGSAAYVGLRLAAMPLLAWNALAAAAVAEPNIPSTLRRDHTSGAKSSSVRIGCPCLPSGRPEGYRFAVRIAAGRWHGVIRALDVHGSAHAL